jgi:hypothetical protein
VRFYRDGIERGVRIQNDHFAVGVSYAPHKRLGKFIEHKVIYGFYAELLGVGLLVAVHPNDGTSAQ